MEGTRPARLDTLTALRNVAALGVLVHHGLSQFVGTGVIVEMASAGRFGVDFFFILSGFVLTWSHRPGQGAARFYWLRFSRVWPLHAATFVLAVLLMGGGPWILAVINLALLQAYLPDPRMSGAFNTPSWTLSIEAFFYLCFPLLIPVVRRLRGWRIAAVCAGAWAVQASLPVLVHFVPPLWPHELWVTVTVPPGRLSEFVVGMGLATAVRNGWRPARWMTALASLGIVATLPALVLLPTLVPRTWAWQLWVLPLFGVVVAAGAARDLRGRSTPRFLVRLGDWSFALYMVHFPLLQLMNHTWGLTGWVWLPVFALMSYVAAALASEGIERPVERWLRAKPVGLPGKGASTTS